MRESVWHFRLLIFNSVNLSKVRFLAILPREWFSELRWCTQKVWLEQRLAGTHGKRLMKYNQEQEDWVSKQGIGSNFVQNQRRKCVLESTLTLLYDTQTSHHQSHSLLAIPNESQPLTEALQEDDLIGTSYIQFHSMDQVQERGIK